MPVMNPKKIMKDFLDKTRGKIKPKKEYGPHTPWYPEWETNPANRVILGQRNKKSNKG